MNHFHMTIMHLNYTPLKKCIIEGSWKQWLCKIWRGKQIMVYVNMLNCFVRDLRNVIIHSKYFYVCE